MEERPMTRRKWDTVSEATRSERTARILSGRLEELARALERAGAPPESAARLLEAASVATLHAVALDILTTERAAEVWREAAERHPRIAQLREIRPPRAA
jgi:hypothetical protein